MNLYHYTSQAGFVGILDTKGVWATDSRFLNDSTEIVHTLHEAKRLVGLIFMDDDYRAAFGFVLRDALEKMDNCAVFVASFSEKPDLLSQWRGYCPSGAGVCMGFDKGQIEEFCEQHGYLLTKCIYEHEMLRNRIAEIVQKCECQLPPLTISRSEYNEMSSFGRVEFEINSHQRLTNGDERVQKALQEACDAIIALAPLFKNEGFLEEAEWRIVATEPTKTPLFFRPGPSYLCPYIEAKILAKKAALREVILGPNPNMERALASASMLLSFKEYDEVDIKMSLLPFNNW
jgi:hypothetical protein